ncbi:MAG: PEGA domain-containing protein [Polyangiaceae bacterium]
MTSWTRAITWSVALSLAASAIAVTWSPTTHAQRAEHEPADVARARDYFRAGAQAYSIGEYAAAVQAFEQAYALAPRPAVLFSIAQAERRLYFESRDRSHLEKAVQRYRDYLNADPLAARKVDTIQALSDLEPLLHSLPTVTETRSEPSRVEATPVTTPTRLMITSAAEGATLSLDGGEPQASPLIREVEPGEHVARVSASGYLSDERRVTAVRGALVTIDVGLMEKPARLVVHAPSGAELSVDGRLQGTCPFPKPLELSPGPHLITLFKRGYVAWSEERRLSRGETSTVVATMPRTTQRTAALIMFGAAASAMTASGVFAYFTLGQESSAKAFLDARGKREFDESDLKEYDSIRTDRDRLRLAALASAGIGVGLAAAGAVLFNYEGKSNPESVPTRTTGGSKGARETATRTDRWFSAQPLLGPHLAGLAVRADF